MKKIYIIFTVIISLLFINCDDDFLEQSSPDRLTESNFYRNKSDAEASLAAAYSQLEGFVGEWKYEILWAFDLFRDEILKPGSDASNYSYFTNIYNFKTKNTNWTLRRYWQFNYKGLNYANQVIYNVGEMSSDAISEKDKKQIVAEAKFLRGYYHFKLLLNWEKIIIRNKKFVESDIAKALTPRADCWDIIIKDFEEAAKDLIGTHPENAIGRVDKYTAHAYAGKVWLFRASEEKKSSYYQKAAENFKQVYDSKKYGLLEDILANFDGTAKNSKESIFELQLTSNSSNGAEYLTHYHMLSSSQLGGWEEIQGSVKGLEKMKVENRINTKYTNSYDSRLYKTFYFQDEFFNDTSKYEAVRGLHRDVKIDKDNDIIMLAPFDTIFKGSEDLISYRKYVSKGELGKPFSYYSGANLPLMRYSDVLLMYAESLNETGNIALAKTCIDIVRKRANMPNMVGSSKEDVFKQIRHERMMEFVGEGQGFFDARRWGLIDQTYTGRGYTNESEFFPIPDAEISANHLINN